MKTNLLSFRTYVIHWHGTSLPEWHTWGTKAYSQWQWYSTIPHFLALLIWHPPEVNTLMVQPFRPLPVSEIKPEIYSELFLLMKLSHAEGGGLSEAQFRGLFIKCSKCHMYMTRGLMGYHMCRAVRTNRVAPTNVIDLTMEDWVDVPLAVWQSDGIVITVFYWFDQLFHVNTLLPYYFKSF